MKRKGNKGKMEKIEESCVNALRILSADQVEKAQSGHPGMPLGSAPAVYELWAKHMRHNPKNPEWVNRDRFVLSAGHGSALLYSLLHLFGYGLTIDDLKNFRQDGSLTPGHPEYGHTMGVEATTGPLGAGMAMAVGMAIAEAHLGAIFNKPQFPIVDHYTYVLGGDGCLMEGISSEAFSLAGTLGLSKLIVLYDSNSITIEGSTNLAFTEDVCKRMEAFGFQTIIIEDGTNLDQISQALIAAKAEKDKPSFIKINTEIGYGCPPKQGTPDVHGAPLGAENIKILRQTLGWTDFEAFKIPVAVYQHYQDITRIKVKEEETWDKMFQSYKKLYPEAAKQWEFYHQKGNAKSLLHDQQFWACENKPDATRNISGRCINYLKDIFPNLIGGSADLGSSNKSVMKDSGDFSAIEYKGRNLHFGVRELAMAGIGNGILLHDGLRAYVATFFVFSDYIKPMARLAAIMQLPLIYILTHDSIGVGEDGATHEPIEQLAMLRAMPNFTVFRPADAAETVAGWYCAMNSEKTPFALVLTRQNLPQYAGSGKKALAGAYIIDQTDQKKLDGILIASGSEVELAVAAKKELAKENIAVNVVSMPSMELFEQQSLEYKESVLPSHIRSRVAIEAGSDFGWGKYVGLDGAVITMHEFGASAPANILFKKYGFTVENVTETMKKVLGK